MWDEESSWSDEAVGTRTSSDKKVRRVRRDVRARAAHWVGEDTTPVTGAAPGTGRPEEGRVPDTDEGASDGDGV